MGIEQWWDWSDGLGAVAERDESFKARGSGEIPRRGRSPIEVFVCVTDESLYLDARTPDRSGFTRIPWTSVADVRTSRDRSAIVVYVSGVDGEPCFAFDSRAGRVEQESAKDRLDAVPGFALMERGLLAALVDAARAKGVPVGEL